VYYVHHRDRTLVMYPVSEESVQGSDFGPPARLVKLAKALADEGRLKVLYALRERDLTTAEIAERLGVPRTTMWHHVLILRGAGLIRTVRSNANQTSYQLREEALPEIGELLDGFLTAEPAARVARRPARHG
jgi:DNA-binding transcriptional ArsR family regulator